LLDPLSQVAPALAPSYPRPWKVKGYLSKQMVPLTNAQIRDFKARAQRLKAMLKIGKDGISPQFLTALDDALSHHELVKVKFDDFKDRKKELSPQLAEKSGSHLVTRVGNVVVLYRPKPEAGTQPED
jgi:RNA-binding protein